MSKTAFGTLVLVVWFIVEGGAFLFYHRIKDPALKRKWHPVVIFGMAAGFMLLVAFMGLQRDAIALIAAGVGLFAWLSLRNIHFCDACGTTLYRYFAMGKMNYCPICGHKLP